MTISQIILCVMASLGAIDTLYYHEYKLKLPLQPTAARELRLHGIRDMFYAFIFLTLGCIEWRGTFAVIFFIILIAEVAITLTDFAEEDKTRKLPAGERAMHAIMGIVFGSFLSQFIPVLFTWWAEPTSIKISFYGNLTWILVLFSVGVFISGIRDLSSSYFKKEVPQIWTEQ